MKNRVKDEGGSSAASHVLSPDNSGAADLVPTAPETIAGRLDAPPSSQENALPMLDVHAPHKAVHTWKDFFIHIATICVGLLVAVGLEQTVEAIHHHHQREQLLVSLDHDTRATLRDADFAAGERLRRMQWNQVRIEQVQAALASHKPLAPAAPEKSAFITVPADAAWEAARASGMIPLFSQGEIAAYSEVADVIGRARPRLDTENNAHSKRRDFEKRYESVSADAKANYRLQAPADLQTYLDLLLAERSALEGSRFMTAVIRGAEAAILEGARDHARIEEREIEAVMSLPK
jgi:hypothetical protein